MKKINYLYFIFIILLWKVMIYYILPVLMQYSPAWLLLVPAYGFWDILFLPVYYILRQRKGVKSGFITSYCMRAQRTTFWLDFSNKELAYLCMFNPFRIYYLPLNAVSNAEIYVHYNILDKKYIDHINCSFFIHNKKTKIRVATRRRYSYINAEKEGKEILSRTQEFVNLLNGDYEWQRF